MERTQFCKQVFASSKEPATPTSGPVVPVVWGQTRNRMHRGPATGARLATGNQWGNTWSARIPAEHALRQGSRAVELLRSRYAVVTAVALHSQSGLRRSMRAVFGVFVSAALSRYG